MPETNNPLSCYNFFLLLKAPELQGDAVDEVEDDRVFGGCLPVMRQYRGIVIQTDWVTDRAKITI
ncbi:hypothetical protein SAMN04487866_12322 [Thermoactinomyces sp. DSM 45891]|nr:hypothetical protein SAMN04487866_12322 [Thermoactinomyces sp. DSM 45891]